MNLLQKSLTVVRNPTMLAHWLRWCGRHLGWRPTIRQPGGQKVSGFRNFNEFWGGRGLIPSDQEIAFINRFAGEKGPALDVGANLGWMSMALTTARPQSIAHAFEPSPETFELLIENVRRNGCERIVPHRLAVGRVKGSLRFMNDAASSSTNRFLRSDEEPNAKVINVEVATLDDFLRSNQIDDVAFLKIDVEGFEADVIQGAARLLGERRCQAGLIELCPGNLARVGRSTGDLLSIVHQARFSLYYLGDNGALANEVDAENAEGVVLANVALLPRK